MILHQLKNLWNLLNTKILKRKSFWKTATIIILLISGLLIARILINNWNQIRSQQWKIDVRFLLLTIILFPVGMFPTAIAWHKLVQAFGIKEDLRTNLRIYAISLLPRHIPGFVWFVTNRSVSYQKGGTPPALSVAASITETAFLSVTGYIIALSLLLFGLDLKGGLSALKVISIIAPLLLIFLVASTPRLNKILNSFLSHRNIQNIPHLDQRNLIWSILWMFLAWIGGGFLLFVLCQAIIPTAFSSLPLLIGMWGAAGAVSLSLGVPIQGMGIRELTLGALLTTIFPPLIAAGLAVVFRLALTIGEFLWVAIFAFLTRERTTKTTSGQ
jgi:uncharacterized membrane protein YbhN (UPF0104 family)